MNLLDLVPAFSRHLNQFKRAEDTDSKLAGYLSDGIEALTYRWSRDYEITFTPPSTYEVNPAIAVKDKRPIILMASIIYKMGNYSFAGFRDGDFAYYAINDSRFNPLILDINELDKILPPFKLAKAVSAPMRGFNNVYNPEGYDWTRWVGLII